MIIRTIAAIAVAVTVLAAASITCLRRSPPATDHPPNLALVAPAVNTCSGTEYDVSTRHWQGIPGIARAPSGCLFATWYSGGENETDDTYCLLVTSDDDGRTWSSPVALIDPPGDVRAADPCVWVDPLGRIWWYWTQVYSSGGDREWDGRGGIWYIRCAAPATDSLTWTAPTRIADGVAINKPVVTSAGEWMLPAAEWQAGGRMEIPGAVRAARVVVSTDCGATWTPRGGTTGRGRLYDEHMVVKMPSCLRMYVRTKGGIGQSVSCDGGYTWSRLGPCALDGPGSRFHIRRLPSGRLLLVNHLPGVGRSNLCVWLSNDDGHTWPWRLLIDGRDDVSYPDACLGAGGSIYVIWDHDRYGVGDICMAVTTEADIMAGRPVEVMLVSGGIGGAKQTW